MTICPPVALPGCRHDVLGHALKAIGILRALAECAAPGDCDPEAEGWWNPDNASFTIRSARYPDAESLVTFLAEKYRPTPIIAAWNKSGGVTDKIRVVISGEAAVLQKFVKENSATLKELGLTAAAAKKQPLSWSPDSSAFAKIRDLLSGETQLELRLKVSIEADVARLKAFKSKHENRLDALGLPKSKRVPSSGRLEFAIRWQHVDDLQDMLKKESLPAASTRKESAKKDGVLPNAAGLLTDDQQFQQSLELARQYVASLQGARDEEAAGEDVFLRYRDQLPVGLAASFDSLCALHINQQNDNPLFVRRGRPGDKVNADIFLNFWDYFVTYRKNPLPLAEAALFGGRIVGSSISAGDQKGKGTPFFPDAIKSYNQGTDWVTEDFPFCPLDYLLAVEGALAMRGATSKTLSARSRSRAAFPFVFEGTETMTDQQEKSLRVATSFWLPVWSQPTTFGELQSFVLDCQARLPGRDCRFSSDFARAIRSQGVDAGFFAFQEFQFKLKGANVPWTTAGRFVPCSGTAMADALNELLAPVDVSGFFDQFEFNRERNADLHPLRAPVLEAIETAAAEPDALKILDVLCGLATLNARLARSKSLREKVGEGRVTTFVPPLRCDDWSAALRDLQDDPEFEIARALASIRGHEEQPDGTYSEVEPFLGSVVPLRRSKNTWYLPEPPSPQAVWSGIDLARDLAAILARRVLDSAKDARPALRGVFSADLSTVLQFLRGELDDRRIARLVEALSLIDWGFHPRRADTSIDEGLVDEHIDPVPVAYAAARSLLEVASESKTAYDQEPSDRSGPRAKVQRTVALFSRQEPRLAAAASAEALRRLAIVGVPNPYGGESQREKPTLAGRDVVQVGESSALSFDLARRLAAAVLIPLAWRDRWTLFRAITLPQTTS
ncbi:MAG: type I-G CRISPR-associated protein Cas8g1/Csx17 [Planctomycetota bacterium]